MPRDRITLGYNYYSNTNVNGSALGQFDAHLETYQFEKTFLDGNASFGARLPFVQVPGENALGMNGIGDLTVITKLAVFADRDSGSVVSGGLAVTLPTGRDLHPVDEFGNSLNSKLRTVLLQPYVGYLLNADDFYLQGFSSAILPTDFSNTVYLANSVVGGFRLYQCNHTATLNYVIPVVEGHLTTPLNNRGLDSGPISATDIFVTTVGVHIGLFNCSQLTLGAAVPLTGPKRFDVEGVVQFSLLF